MTINNVKFRIRDLIYAALIAAWLYGFLWMALAMIEPGEQAIIEGRL